VHAALLSPHPSLPPHRGEGVYTYPCQPAALGKGYKRSLVSES
jgi:hypothetical protein